MTRKPVVAGQFYSDNIGELDNQIKACFEGERGPATTPSKRGDKVVKGIIAPHAGYQFSGECAAWAYKEIGEAQFADVYLVVGPSHSGHKSCFSKQNFETPLGLVKVDEAFLRILREETMLPVDDEAHMDEHSIEVQLPFLQYANKSEMNLIRFVPLMIGPNVGVEKIAEGVKRAIEKYGKKVCVIASSDFTHYGVNYGYMPFFKDRKEKLYELDKGAIELISRKDTEGFLNYVEDQKMTICGFKAIALLMSCVDYDEAELLQYYTSGDVVGDYNNAVGYGAVVFR